MLRPEQMSKVSVTGAKSVMDEVIETMHGMHLVHITDYDGSWEGFEPGESLEGADDTSSKLVTVRAIESILDISEEDASPTEAVDTENADERLEELREEVNELDDRRDELRGQLRDIEERLDQMELFADLGLDLDLLWGYDSLDVLVGEGSSEEVEAALAEADDVREYDVFSGTGRVAAFGYMQADADLDDALVGVPFTEYQVPEESGNPESVVDELEHERQQVEAELEKVENEIEATRLDSAAFILALEEELTVDAQKAEAPLRFATTERSFIVEGWVPTGKYDEFADELQAAVDDRVEIDEIQRASYTSGGHLAHEDVHDAGHDEEANIDDAKAATDGGHADDKRAATDGGVTAAANEEVATDGGHADGDLVTVEEDPPVIQKNSSITGPFEVLVKAVNRPKYSEFDPTVLIFLTFPFFFGFMIGDIGYGLLYVLIGYFVASKFDSEAVANFGIVVVWMGLFTAVFGVLYGEVFGLHFLEWFGAEAVLHKGITERAWAETWLIAAVIFGWLQLNIGYIFNITEEYQLHGPKPALFESGSWFLMLNGGWLWIFSTHVSGPKPSFLVGHDAVLQETLNIPFTGFPAIVGMAGLGMFGLGVLLILVGPHAYEIAEGLVPIVHVLSYTRLTAVLLSKAGMALAANMLYFGAYRDEEGFHFMHSYEPGYEPKHGEVVFGGLSNMGTHVDIGPLAVGIEGAIIGLPVLLIAHVVVLAVGGTAALQAIRLEYVEFFEKFYEGGGKNYQPFGYDRTYTTDA